MRLIRTFQVGVGRGRLDSVASCRGRLQTLGAVADEVLAEDGQEAAPGRLSDGGADGLEVKAADGSGGGVGAVEISNAEDIGSTALGGVLETRARIVAATGAATGRTARGAGVGAATSAGVAGAGSRAAAIAGVAAGSGHGASGEEESGDGENLHFDWCFGGLGLLGLRKLIFGK
jgi:hypothetical protein